MTAWTASTVVVPHHGPPGAAPSPSPVVPFSLSMRTIT